MTPYPFKFKVHYFKDFHTGEDVYPDRLDLCSGSTVVASIDMFELKDALDELDSYVDNIK